MLVTALKIEICGPIQFFLQLEDGPMAATRVNPYVQGIHALGEILPGPSLGKVASFQKTFLGKIKP